MSPNMPATARNTATNPITYLGDDIDAGKRRIQDLIESCFVDMGKAHGKPYLGSCSPVQLGHTSREKAYLTDDYPFGFQLRCLRLTWLETAMKGSHKYDTRMVHQTTTKAFNAEYTRRIAGQFLNDRIRIGQAMYEASLNNPAHWNKANASTYQPLMVLFLGPAKGSDGHTILEDGVPRQCIQPYSISQFDQPVGILKLKAMLGKYLVDTAIINGLKDNQLAELNNIMLKLRQQEARCRNYPYYKSWYAAFDERLATQIKLDVDAGCFTVEQGVEYRNILLYGSNV